MFAKKKAVPTVARSRFTKAKPNVKIAPKPSQPSQQTEKNKEINSASDINGASRSSNSNIKEESISLQSNGVEDITNDASKNVSLTKKESFNNITNHKALVTDRDLSNDILTENSLNQNEYDTFTDHSTPTNTLLHSTENNLPYSLDGGTGEKSLVHNSPDNFQKQSINREPQIILPEVSSPTKTANQTLDDNAEHELVNTLPNNELSDIESPEKSFSGFTPTKSSGGNTTDKSSKYPCITRLLAGTKKRSQNKEINERKKKMASFKELPPRNEMTFTDLIYWKPATAPMKLKESKSLLLFDPKDNEPSATEEVEGEDEEDEDNTSVAPKLLLNENGEIIIDESSLVVKRKKTPIDMSAEVIDMDNQDITYGTFRRRTSKQWSPKETVNFYKALSVVGTDFALMENIIPNRTRRELKIKFKKEEKINMELLHRAMYETDTFQSDLSVEDLNLDVVDIPGLEEHIVKETISQNGKRRKRKEQVLSEIAPNDAEDENSQSLPLKRGRGRPKKVKQEKNLDDNKKSLSVKNGICDKQDDSSPVSKRQRRTAKVFSQDSTENSDIYDEQDDSSPLSRRKRTAKVLSQDSIENSDIYNEQDDSSPLSRRKRTAKVLSQDSIENSDEFVEIQVQINSLDNNEESEISNSQNSPAKKKHGDPKMNENVPSYNDSTNNDSLPANNESLNIFTFNNPEESPTDNNESLNIFTFNNAEESLTDNNESLNIFTFNNPEESLTDNNEAIMNEAQKHDDAINLPITKSANNLTIDMIIDNLPPKSSTLVSALKSVAIKTEKLPLPESSKTEMTENGRVPYRRTRKLKIKPNIRSQKNTATEVQTKEPVSKPQDIFPHPASPGSVIAISDDQLLSDCVTDVVTTAMPKVIRRSKIKPNLSSIKPNLFSVKQEFINKPKTINRLQPSSLNYTPIIESESDDIGHDLSVPYDIQSNSNPKRGSNELMFPLTFSHSQQLESFVSSSCSSPVITTDSSSLVTSLTMSSREPISIPFEPEGVDVSEPSGLMVMTESPAGKSLHFYVSNAFSGGLPLPSENSSPLIDTAIKSEGT